MAMRSVKDLNVSGKRVLCRVDFNVSIDKKTSAIKDDTRVVAALPTIKALTAALCPQHAGFMNASEHSRWQRDGEIYANYLASLLCAATDFLQQEHE